MHNYNILEITLFPLCVNGTGNDLSSKTRLNSVKIIPPLIYARIVYVYKLRM